MRNIESALSAFLLVGCLLLINSCNQTFEPLAENEQFHFSIYGYLDASADTQWVRVGTARETLDETPDPSGITVTLEDLQTGEKVEMQDSLFITENFLNYWSTMDIENEKSYRIKIEGPDGKSSHVSVTTPKKLPTPLVLVNTYPPYGYSVYIDDIVESIADIQSIWYVIINPETDPIRKTYTFSYRNEMEHVEVYDGAFTAFAPLEEEEGHIESNLRNAEYEIVHRQFFVAAGGPEWNEEIGSIDDLEYFLNSTVSNVVDGLGYVIGIDSKWVPYRSCTNESGSLAVPCPSENPFW